MPNSDPSSSRLETYLLRRRSLLQLAALAGIGAVAPGIATPARAKPATPLHFVGWQYNPQIVAENVATFEKLYDENVDYQLVAGEYQALLETMLVAGKKFDMLYSEEATLARWVAAQWAQNVEDMPDVAAIKASMVPVGVRNLSLPDGKLGGLPYYAGYNAFVYNDKHLSQAKLQPPTTWDELLDQARKLKQDKIAEYPYVSAWEHTWAGSVVEPVRDLVFRRRQGLRQQLQPGVRRQVQEGAGDAPDPVFGRARAVGHLHPAAGGRAELRHRPAQLHGRARLRPEGAE